MTERRPFQCRDCGEPGEARSHRGPLPTRCDPCRRKKESEAAAEWNRANGERHRANKRASHQRHKEHYNAVSRDYREANPERVAERQREWKAARPHYERDRRLGRDFGMSADDYDAMLAVQGGCCAICGTAEPGGRWGTFAVDHCHETGRVRGLLCNRCNKGIGLLRDRPQILRSAAEYIERARESASIGDIR